MAGPFLSPFTLQIGTTAGTVADGGVQAANRVLALGAVQASTLGQPNGPSQLDGTGRTPWSQLPASLAQALYYVGGWNPATNTPQLVSGTLPTGQTSGAMYKVSVSSSSVALSTSTGQGAVGPTLAFASTSGVTLGMLATSPSIPAGVTVTALTSTQVTLSNSTSVAVASGVSITFAPYLDGITQFSAGDEVMYSSATNSWSKIDGISSEVLGVLGLVGAITLPQLVTGGLAPVASPQFTGVPTAPVQSTADTSAQVVTSQWVRNQGFLTANQGTTVTGDVTGVGGTNITLTIAPTGVTAGTYAKVAVNLKGQVTAGTSLVAADITTALGGNAALTVNQADVGGGYAARGQYGQISFGGSSQGLVLRGTSTAGASVRLTADNSGSGNTTNSLPISVSTGGRVAGRWQVKNTANGDVAGGDFSFMVARGTGTPVLGTTFGGTAVSLMDYAGSTLATPPLPVFTVDAVNNSINVTWPGYGGLTVDVRIVVDDAFIY